MNKEIAILVAAGKGSRLLPLTDTVPKPLIKVQGKPMIETLIEALRGRGVETIYITVGYKKEQFSYLAKAYPAVVLVENTEYQTKNNISSLYALRERLGYGDCFICDADLYIKDDTIFRDPLENSCFFGKYVPGPTEEWVFKVKDGRMTHLCIGGENDYNLVGISYWRQKDAAFLREAVKKAYGCEGHEALFWEEVADLYLDRLYVTVHPIAANCVAEIDTLDELKAMDPSYGEE